MDAVRDFLLQGLLASGIAKGMGEEYTRSRERLARYDALVKIETVAKQLLENVRCHADLLGSDLHELALVLRVPPLFSGVQS